MTVKESIRGSFSDAGWTTRAAGRQPMGRWWRWGVRIVGAGLLVAMGWIHLHLYDLGYSSVPTIGALFYLNAVLGGVVALAVLVTPTRWLPVASTAGALLQIGTLGALVLSLTVGLFGFDESFAAPLVRRTIAVESAGFLVLAAHVAYEGPLFLRAVKSRLRGGRGRAEG